VAKIEIGRYSDLLRRALGMKGVSDVAADLSPEISPVWELERDAQEWGFLKQVRWISAATRFTSGVGLLANVRLRNPPGSGALVVVDRVELNAPSSTTFNVVFSPAVAQVNLVGAITAGGQDGRLGFIRSIATLTEGSVASVGTFSLWQPFINAGEPAVWNQQIILPPNSSVDFALPNTNINLHVSLSWHERSIQPLELA